MKKTAIVVLSLLTVTAMAETAPLADPTRPAGFSAGVVEGSEGGLRLQSVVSPRGGRPMAIISGQMVSLGQKMGDARLIRLSETEAVLRGPKGVERLFLVPDVSKKSEVLKAAAMDNGRREKQ